MTHREVIFWELSFCCRHCETCHVKFGPPKRSGRLNLNTLPSPSPGPSANHSPSPKPRPIRSPSHSPIPIPIPSSSLRKLIVSARNISIICQDRFCRNRPTEPLPSGLDGEWQLLSCRNPWERREGRKGEEERKETSS